MASQPTNSSNASRYFFVFLIGLVIGVIGVVMVLRAIEGRKTWEDHFPDAVMHVMDAHSAQLKTAAKANRCGATDVLPHLQTLRYMANDLEPALPGLRDDPRFIERASHFRANLDSALATPPLNCAGVETAIKQIDDGCKACHQDFRG